MIDYSDAPSLIVTIIFTSTVFPLSGLSNDNSITFVLCLYVSIIGIAEYSPTLITEYEVITGFVYPSAAKDILVNPVYKPFTHTVFILTDLVYS